MYTTCWDWFLYKEKINRSRILKKIKFKKNLPFLILESELKRMASIKTSMEVSVEVRVKNEPICDTQSISETKKTLKNKVNEEQSDIEMQTSKSKIESRSEEVQVKTEEKFSATEESANKIPIQTTSIAFLNEETNTTAIHEPNETQKMKTNKLQDSK